MSLQEIFGGYYLGAFTDKFGTQWMINCASKTRAWPVRGAAKESERS